MCLMLIESQASEWQHGDMTKMLLSIDALHLYKASMVHFYSIFVLSLEYNVAFLRPASTLFKF